MPEPHRSAAGEAEQQERIIEEQVTQITELKELLLQERQQNESLMRTVSNLRTGTASLLNTCEQAQEGISNRLIKEISRLKSLQLAMCDDVEAQEARLVDVLEERLRTLRAEKCELENTLEQEQERIVNKLQRQMEELRLLHDSETHHPHQPSPLHSPPPIASLSEQVNIAVAQHREREAELQRQIVKLQEENQQLVCENIKLQNKLRRQSIEDSPLLEPLGSPPLRRSDSQSSKGKAAISGSSLTDLHLSVPTRRSFQSDHPFHTSRDSDNSS